MKKTIKDASTDAFNLSISDLMAGLLAVFIFILCYYILSFNSMKKDYEGNNQLRRDMLVELQEKFRKDNIIVNIEEDKGVLHLQEGSVFFKSSASVSNEAGENVIRKLAKAINETIHDKRYKEKIGTIFIEGHTDDERQAGTTDENEFDAYNWGLSTRRAIYTWKIMSESEPELPNFKNVDKDLVFSCSGYGPTRALDPKYKDVLAKIKELDDIMNKNGGLTPEENKNLGELTEKLKVIRRNNRRIDIRFTMILPKDKDDKSNPTPQNTVKGNMK